MSSKFLWALLVPAFSLYSIVQQTGVEECNAASKAFSNTDLNARIKNLLNDVASFSDHVTKTWAEGSVEKDRLAVQIEGPIEELSMEALVAPHLDMSNTSEATKTMLDRDYVSTV